MADAPALPSSPPPAPTGDGGPSSVPRVLPSTLLRDTPAPSSGRVPPRGPRGGRAAAAAGSGGRGGGRRSKPALLVATSYRTGGRGPDPLVRAVRMVGALRADVDAGLANPDFLQLALAKGPMFTWPGYWPEEGFRKEDHPY